MKIPSSLSVFALAQSLLVRALVRSLLVRALVRSLSVRALMLLSCAVLLGGCGEGKRDAGKNGGKQQNEAEYARQRYLQSDAIEKEAELAAQRLTENLAAAESLYRIMLMTPESARSMAALQAVAPPLPVADFRACIVVVQPSAQVENLSTLERARARAAAFGLDWIKSVTTQRLFICCTANHPRAGAALPSQKSIIIFPLMR